MDNAGTKKGKLRRGDYCGEKCEDGGRLRMGPRTSESCGARRRTRETDRRRACGESKHGCRVEFASGREHALASTRESSTIYVVPRGPGRTGNSRLVNWAGESGGSLADYLVAAESRRAGRKRS